MSHCLAGIAGSLSGRTSWSRPPSASPPRTDGVRIECAKGHRLARLRRVATIRARETTEGLREVATAHVPLLDSGDERMRTCRMRRCELARVSIALLAAAGLGACSFGGAPRPARPPAASPASVEALLTAPRIRVEIDWLPGCRPTPETVEGVRTFLTAYAAPSEGVEVVLDQEIATDPERGDLRTGEAVSAASLHRIAARHRQPDAPGSASIYLLFVSRFEDETRFHRGVAYPQLGIALVARDALRRNAFLTVRGDEIERFVTQHEVGHLLGLVADGRHGEHGHCTDPRCILYARPDWRAVLANGWRLFTGTLPGELDASCRQELSERRALAMARATSGR